MKIRHAKLVFSFFVLSAIGRVSGGEEPICRIAAVSSPYITTLSAKELGERSWIEKVAPAGLEKTIAIVNAVKPDAMIVMGSLTWSGSDADFGRVRKYLNQIEVPLHVVPGPRDLPDGDDTAYLKLFTKENVAGKSIDIKGVHLHFATSTLPETGAIQKNIVAQMKSGLSAAKDARAVLLFGGLELRPFKDPKAASPQQREYWQLIHDHKIAARFTGGHAHTVRYEDSLPIWSIPSSGWSYGPKWPIALITVYSKRIELDLVHGALQPMQRLVIPNPVAAARMTTAAADPYGIPTFSEDLARKPKLTFVQLSDSQFDDGHGAALREPIPL